MRKLLFLFLAVFILSCSGGTKSSSTNSQGKDQQEKIEIVAQNLIQDEYSTTVIAVIHNNANKVATYVDLSSYFYDADGKVIATGMGNATNIEPGQSKNVEILCADKVTGATQYKVELGNVMW